MVEAQGRGVFHFHLILLHTTRPSRPLASVSTRSSLEELYFHLIPLHATHPSHPLTRRSSFEEVMLTTDIIDGSPTFRTTLQPANSLNPSHIAEIQHQTSEAES